MGGGGGSGGGGDAGGLGLSRAATTSRCGGLVATASGALVAVTASDVLRAVAALAASRAWLAALVACAARTEEAEEMAELASIKVCTAPYAVAHARPAQHGAPRAVEMPHCAVAHSFSARACVRTQADRADVGKRKGSSKRGGAAKVETDGVRPAVLRGEISQWCAQLALGTPRQHHARFLDRQIRLR